MSMLRTDRVRGEEVTGYEMLEARENRASRQSEWLAGQEGCCLVSVTMNIAGTIKSTPLIRDGFSAGMEMSALQQRPVRRERIFNF